VVSEVQAQGSGGCYELANPPPAIPATAAAILQDLRKADLGELGQIGVTVAEGSRRIADLDFNGQ
jgi:hypothetical protein